MRHAYLTVLLGAAIAATAPVPVHAAGTTSWQNSVASMIARQQKYPRSAAIRGEQGVTRLRVALAPDGRITHVDLAQSSGSEILDRAAESMATRIAKFPPPPAGLDSLLIPIVWRLN